MTYQLICSGHPVKAFEIDPAYSLLLRDYFGETGLLEVVEGDVLDTWPLHAPPEGLPKILGNLPYNAASAIIASLIESGRSLGLIVITVQKEMAARMGAKVGTKDYSSFSILTQSAFSLEFMGELKAGSFFPAPRVDSMIVKLTPKSPHPPSFRKIMGPLVRGLFSSRRKTIRNNLKTAANLLKIPQEKLQALFLSLGIDLNLRPESLDLQLYEELAQNIQSTFSGTN